MKKLITMLLILTLLLCLPIVAQGAQEEHIHCVCGGAAEGVGDHTQCNAVTWTPISEALAKIGRDRNSCDFGLLPGGYYYLDGDVTVTGSNHLGGKKDTLATTADKVVTMSVCLNGYSIHRDDRAPFGVIHMGSTLNICDCSYNAGAFQGSILGATQDHGSVIYTYSDSTLNIYGGNFSGRATKNGGVLVIANDGCGDVNGDGEYTESDRNAARPGVFNFYNGKITGHAVDSGGGAIRLYHTSVMNMYGGQIIGGQAQQGGAIHVGSATLNISGGQIIGGAATSKGGTFYLGSGECYISGGTITGGTVAGKPEVCQVLNGSGKLLGTYTDLSEAFSAVQGKTDRYVRMINDCHSDATVTGTVYLDLCGRKLSGIHISGELYAMDSTTNTYDDSRAGTLIPASGTPVREHKTTEARVGGIYRYLALETDGAWSFHRFYMGITKISLRLDTTGMGYKATFAGGPAVTAAMEQTAGYGYQMWIDPSNVVSRAMAAKTLQGSREVSLRIENFLQLNLSTADNEKRAATPVSACVFIRLQDGTVVKSNAVSYTFRQLVEMADPMVKTFSTRQKILYNNLSKRYSEAMRSWDIPNVHHVSGGIWTSVNQEQFLAKLNSSAVITPGSYALTSNVDLGARTVKIQEGATVRICLNGYKITGSSQLFRVLGTFDICDCHAPENEGSMISSLTLGSGTTLGPVFEARYSSEVNLYGGHLKATKQVTSGGVCVVYHSAKSGANAEKPAGKFNMYGGSLSGGNVTNNGGLIITWDGAAVNIYGGVLEGGRAGLAGGAISAVGGSTVGIYGGTITGNTATNGGGINLKDASLTLGGTTQITGNTATDEGQDVYLASAGAILDMEGIESGAKLGLSCADYRILGSNPAIVRTVTCENPDSEIKMLYGRATVVPSGTQELKTPTGFTAGFGQVCINPRQIEGISLGGYGNSTVRLAEAQDPADWDDLYTQVTAITDREGETVLIITSDLLRNYNTAKIAECIHAATNVPVGNIFFNVSHSHSVPDTTTISNPKNVQFNEDLGIWMTQAAYKAMQDRAPATMQTGSFEVSFVNSKGQTKRMNFMRHYQYTDAQGVVRYFGDNFGEDMRSDPTADHIWEIDPTMHLVRFIRDGKDILLTNWRMHPHQTGGSQKRKLSADVIGTFRYYLAQECPDTYIAYIQGAAGNANSSSKLASTSAGLADYIAYGQTLAKVVKANLGCLQSVADPGCWQVDNHKILGYFDQPTQAQYDKAVALKQYCDENFDGSYMKYENDYCRLNSDGMFESYYEVTAIINRYENPQYSKELPVNTFALGDSLGFFTAPNELWDSISVTVEGRSLYRTTICVGYSMENHGYMPYYPESYLKKYFPADIQLVDGVPYKSYESGCRSNYYRLPDTVEQMIEYWVCTLNRFHG